MGLNPVYGERGSASLFMNWGLGLCGQRGSEAEPLIKWSGAKTL